MGQIVTGWIAALIAADGINAFIERYAVHIPEYSPGPDFRFIQWGWHGAIPFLAIKLPSWAWTMNICRLEYGWAQRVLFWSGNRGWGIYESFAP